MFYAEMIPVFLRYIYIKYTQCGKKVEILISSLVVHKVTTRL